MFWTKIWILHFVSSDYLDHHICHIQLRFWVDGYLSTHPPKNWHLLCICPRKLCKMSKSRIAFQRQETLQTLNVATCLVRGTTKPTKTLFLKTFFEVSRVKYRRSSLLHFSISSEVFLHIYSWNGVRILSANRTDKSQNECFECVFTRSLPRNYRETHRDNCSVFSAKI